MLTLRISAIAVCTTLLTACGTNPGSPPIPAADSKPATTQPVKPQQQRSYVAQVKQKIAAQRQAEQDRQREQQQVALNRLAQQRQQEAQQQQQEAQARQQQTQVLAQRAQVYQDKAQQEQARQAQAQAARQQQQEAQARQLAAVRQQQQAQQQQLAQIQSYQPPQVQQVRQIQAPPRIITPPTIQSYSNRPAPQPQQQSQPAQLQYASSRMYTGPGQYNRLPDTVASNLRLRGASESGFSAYVRPAAGNAPAILTANADKARSPASTMKLVTTYTALGTLGANYQWPTEIYTTGNVQGGTLFGDVIIKGYGNPTFSEGDFRTMLQALRARGVNNINGNLVADNSFFDVPYQHPGAFDGNAGAAYNAQPEAILYQERGGCYQFTNLKGKIEKICPVLPRSAKARADLNVNLFGGFWKLWVGELRGQMQGSFMRGNTPGNAQLVYTHRSAPLREIIMEVNKDSNNVMARQLLLSVGAKQMGAPGTPQKGAATAGQWLASRGLNFPELRIENGSGLSRVARISARHLGEMLVDAYNSPYRDDYMNSLAVLGVDGTLKNRMKRSAMTGRGKFKTGTLKDVRGLAGYLQASNGQTYVVSILHNDPSARTKGREAQDELVEWVYWGPRNSFAALQY